MRSHEVRRTFCPPRALRNPHVQSILATLGLRARLGRRDGRGESVETRDVIVRSDDVTRIVVAHTPPQDPSSSRGTAILFHGWEGSVPEDDPLIPVDDLLELETPDCLQIEIQRWGGHCGFIDNPGGRGWLERRVAEILEKPIK